MKSCSRVTTERFAICQNLPITHRQNELHALPLRIYRTCGTSCSCYCSNRRSDFVLVSANTYTKKMKTWSDEDDDGGFDPEETRRALEESAAAAASTAFAGAASNPTPAEVATDERELKQKKKKKRKNSSSPHRHRHDKEEGDEDDGGGKMPAKESSSMRQQDAADSICIRTSFGQCYRYEDPSPTTTPGDVKQWLVQEKHLQAEHCDIVHFIDYQKRIVLKDDATIEYVKGLCKLYVVFVTDQKQTGAIGEPDIYAPTCENDFPSVAAASAAGASSLSEEKIIIPSYFKVTGLFTEAKGYHGLGKTSTISVPEGCEVTYLQRFCITPQLLHSIRGVDSGGSDLADLLSSVKIGESGSVKDAFVKFKSKRTYICFAQQAFVMFIHQANSVDIETSLHTRFALKKGNAFGEFYEGITELDFYDTIEHFEQFPGVMIVFGTTNFTECSSYNTALSGSGYVYRACFALNQQQSTVINALKSRSNEKSTLPFTEITCNTNDFCEAFVARKIGMTRKGSEEELEKYLARKLLWANGIVPTVAFNFIQSGRPGDVEKTLHNHLRSFNIHGEWFREDGRPTLQTKRYDSLFKKETHAVSRSVFHYWLTKNDFRRFISVYGILTHQIAWNLIKSGAVVFDPNTTTTNEVLDELESAFLPFIDPVDKTPVRRSELLTRIKTELAGDHREIMDQTGLEASFKRAAKWGKCIKVKLGNKDSFIELTNEAALVMFEEIFGEEKRYIALRFVNR